MFENIKKCPSKLLMHPRDSCNGNCEIFRTERHNKCTNQKLVTCN